MKRYWATIHGEGNLDQQINVAGMTQVILAHEADAEIEKAWREGARDVIEYLEAGGKLKNCRYVYSVEDQRPAQEPKPFPCFAPEFPRNKEPKPLEKIGDKPPLTWEGRMLADKINALVDAVNELRNV